MEVNKKAIKIVLNADKISRKHSQETDNSFSLTEGKTLFEMIFEPAQAERKGSFKLKILNSLHMIIHYLAHITGFSNYHLQLSKTFNSKIRYSRKDNLFFKTGFNFDKILPSISNQRIKLMSQSSWFKTNYIVN